MKFEPGIFNTMIDHTKTTFISSNDICLFLLRESKRLGNNNDPNDKIRIDVLDSLEKEFRSFKPIK